MTNDQARGIVKDATENAVKDVRARRSTWIAFGVLLACIVAAVAYYGPRLASVSAHAQEQDSRIVYLTIQSAQNGRDALALADQVRALGGTPVVLPAPPAAVGQTGATGTAGLNGRDGVNGITPPCLSTPAQCQGADGSTGTAGTDGTDGVDGQPGKDGADGKDGQPGRDGEQGPPGPACPDGYEPRPAVITAPDGSTYQGVACVDPATSQPPPDDPPILPLPGGN